MSLPAEAQFLQIETAAHEGAHGHNPLALPTEAQHAAGNYKKGRLTWQGLRIAIEQPRGTYRTGRNRDGKAWSTRMAAHYGYFEGVKGADGDELDCFIGFYPQAETVYVVNQQVNGRFDEHKCLICFPDQASAERAYRDSYERGWNGLHSITPASISQLKWWLKNGDKSRPLLPEFLPHEGLETMNTPIAWDASAQPKGMNAAVLLYEIRRSDAGAGLLMDSVTRADILEDADEVFAMDAMVTPYAKVERKMDILRGVMERASATVKPVALQVTDPFKQRGVVNVAGIFELSDGQTVSVYLHNPDTTPNKLAPTDELISWKWLLNKKDITIVVAPEQGEDLNVREVARRIMTLAEKNSAAFQRVNSKRAERMQAIQGLKDEIAGLEVELTKAQRELEVAKVEAEGRAKPSVQKGAPAPKSEVLVYGLRAGQTERYTEELLATVPVNEKTEDNINRVKEAATKDGWHSFRVANFMPGVVPEFGKNMLSAGKDPGTEGLNIELTGNELGEFPDTEEGLVALRDAAISFYERNLINSDGVYNSDLGANVFFDKTGAKKVKSLSADPVKLRMIPKLKEIIGLGQKTLEMEPSEKAARRGVVKAFVLKKSVKVGGREVVARLIVHLRRDGTFSYDHAVDRSEASKGVGGSSGAMDSVDATDHSQPVLHRSEPSFRHALGPIVGNERRDINLALDAAAGGGMVFNLFIEGEEPEEVGEEDYEQNPTQAQQTPAAEATENVAEVQPEQAAKPIAPADPRKLPFEWIEHQRAPAMRLEGSKSGFVAVPARGNRDAGTWNIVNTATGEVVRKIQKPKFARSDAERDLVSREESALYGAGGYYAALQQYDKDLKAFEEAETAKLWANAPAIADVAAELQKIKGWDVSQSKRHEDEGALWIGNYANSRADTELMQDITREIWLNGNPIPKELASASAADVAAWIHVQEAVFAGDEEAAIDELADRYDPDTGEVATSDDDSDFERQIAGMPKGFIRSAMLVESFTEALGGEAIFGDFNHTASAGLFDSSVQQLPFGICAQIGDGVGNLKGRADIGANGDVLILAGATGLTPITLPGGEKAAASSKDGAILAMLKAAIGSPSEPQPTQDPAAQSEPQEFRHAGFLIRKSAIGPWGKKGDYWAVQSIKNKKLEDLGEPQWDIGDTPFESIEEAKVFAETLALQMATDAEAEREQAEKARADADAEAAFMDDLKGFADGMTPLQRGAVLRQLRKTVFYNGSYMTIKNMIKSRVDAGWRIEFEGTPERVLTDGEVGLDQKTATKIGLDFAAYLIAKRSASNQQEPEQPATQQDPAKAAAIAMMQAIIDGTTDPLTADLDALEAAFTSYQDDAEIAALFERAVDVVMQAEAKATEGV